MINIIIAAAFVVIFLFVVGSQCNHNEKQKPEYVKIKEDLRKEEIENCFNLSDGSHITLEKYIKKSMKDPSSYQHIETKYTDQKDHLFVNEKYRGRNSFGDIVQDKIGVKTENDCKIIEIIIPMNTNEFGPGTIR